MQRGSRKIGASPCTNAAGRGWLFTMRSRSITAARNTSLAPLLSVAAGAVRSSAVPLPSASSAGAVVVKATNATSMSTPPPGRGIAAPASALSANAAVAATPASKPWPGTS